MSSNDVDIDEMFSQMSEKLGWLQLGDVDSAISSLTKKQKHKKSAKKGSTTKRIRASSKNNTTTTTSSSSSTSSRVKPKTTKKKQDVSGKSDVRSNGDCNIDAIKTASNHKKNIKPDLLEETSAKALWKIHDSDSDSEEVEQLLAMTTQECLDSPDLSMNSTDDDSDNDDISGGCKDYNEKLGKDKTSLVTAVSSQPPKPHSPPHQHSDDSNSNSLRSNSDLSVFDDSSSMTGICKKISFTSDDSTTERSLNSSDTASTTKTIQTPPVSAETVKSPEIPNVAVSDTEPSFCRSSIPVKIQSPCPPNTSIQYFGKGDESSKDTTDGVCNNNKETQLQMPSLTNNEQTSSFFVEEFFSCDDDDDDDNDDCFIDCDDLYRNYSPSPTLPILSDIKRGRALSRNSGGSARTPLAALNERRCQTERRPHKFFNNSSDDSSSDENKAFETFLSKMKTPAKKKSSISPMPMEVFLVSGSESSSENSDSDDKYSISLYHRTRPISPLKNSPLMGPFDNDLLSLVRKVNPRQYDLNKNQIDQNIEPSKENNLKTKTGKHGGSGDDGVFRKPSVTAGTNTNPSARPKSTGARFKTPVWDKRSTPLNNVSPNVPCGGKVPQTCPTLKNLPRPPPPPPPPSFLQRQADKRPAGDSNTSFLKSLSGNTENASCINEEARKYVKYFQKYRIQLVKKLFAIFNETIFNNRFPADFPIVWNKRLLTTAGHCKLKKKTNGLTVIRTAEVNLAVKVCDTAERVRDTLIHELCHAAVWLFNGSHEGHGKLWKSWAKRANQRYPSLPVIERCHNYKIAKKYTYKCVRCNYSFGRHSKSLDTTKKACGYCYGRFVLVTNAAPTHESNKGGSGTAPTRTPNKFALFVKEHYGTVKKSNSGSHKDIMNILSQKFKKVQIC